MISRQRRIIGDRMRCPLSAGCGDGPRPPASPKLSSEAKAAWSMLAYSCLKFWRLSSCDIPRELRVWKVSSGPCWKLSAPAVWQSRSGTADCGAGPVICGREPIAGLDAGSPGPKEVRASVRAVKQAVTLSSKACCACCHSATQSWRDFCFNM